VDLSGVLEIMSTAVLLAVVVADVSRVFHAIDSATLQVTHRCTPAPYGMLAAPAALPTGMSNNGTVGLVAEQTTNSLERCSQCQKSF